MKTFRPLLAVAALALAALPAAAAPNTYSIDTAHSSAGFAVTHLSISTVRGELGPVTGTVTFDPADATKTVIDASIDVNGVSTQNEKRDTHLKSPDFFDVAKFPKATFKSTSVTKSGDELKIEGDLTLHGVTKKVTLTGKASAEVAHPMMKGTFVIAFSATTKINRKEFGVAYGPDAVVSDNVDVTISVEGDRK